MRRLGLSGVHRDHDRTRPVVLDEVIPGDIVERHRVGIRVRASA